MKKFFLMISVLFVFNSCDLDDEPKLDYVLLPVESVEMPAAGFNINEVNFIKVRYRRPTTCHLYDNFYVETNNHTRTIAIRTIVFEQNNCTPLTDNLLEQYINFYVTGNGPFLFKFWQGKNEAGEDVFLEYEVPVID